MGRLDDIIARNRGEKPDADKPVEPAPATRRGPIPDPDMPPGKRLDNIIERNRRKGWPRERIVVMFGLGVALLLILALMLFTDLGVPKQDDGPADPLPAKAKRANDIQLGPAPSGSAKRHR